MLTRILPAGNKLTKISKLIRYSSTVPVYEKPYNPAKYEVPSENLKLSTGYAFLDVEPMPRARIMKLGYIMLDGIKKAPENTNIRLWYEERCKWVMETVDETEDIRELEIKLGGKIIEEFIQDFHNEYFEMQKLIELKCWEEVVMDPEEEAEFNFLNQSRLNNKYGVFGRENKESLEFLEAQADKQAIE